MTASGANAEGLSGKSARPRARARTALMQPMMGISGGVVAEGGAVVEGVSAFSTFETEAGFPGLVAGYGTLPVSSRIERVRVQHL